MGKFQGSILLLIVLVILCWPAALIYLVVKWDDQPVNYDIRSCTSCGANIPINYQVCPYCGRPTYPFQNVQQQYYPTAKNDNATGKTCVNCKKPVRPSDRFCQFCGTKQDE